MKILLMEKNLILLSRIRSSLEGHQVRVGTNYEGEDIVLISLEQFPVEKVAELKALGVKVIAYCGHKNIEAMKKAQELGADLVVPNSQIVQVGSLIESL